MSQNPYQSFDPPTLEPPVMAELVPDKPSRHHPIFMLITIAFCIGAVLSLYAAIGYVATNAR